MGQATPPSPPEPDGFDVHTSELLDRLSALRQQLPSGEPTAESDGSQDLRAARQPPSRPVPETFGPHELPARPVSADRSHNETSHQKSVQAIGRGFEIYTRVLTGSLMIAIPAILGYYLDRWLGIVGFMPAGVVIGMVSGLRFLISSR